MPIDFTPSGTNSNSYVSVAEADSYFDLRLNADTWTTATTEDKEKALVMATFRLEQEQYDFWRTNLFQALKWPRTSVVSPDGVALPSGVIPVPVKNATFEMALEMLKGDFLSNTGLSKFRQLSLAGVISLTPRFLSSGELPDSVQRWLVGYWIGSAGTVRIVRS